jgi:nitrogen fixation protein NifU and related proteins
VRRNRTARTVSPTGRSPRRDIAFKGAGCAILLASASLMTLAEGARAVAGRFVALAGVRAYPGRVNCATLPWHALRVAIEGS